MTHTGECRHPGGGRGDLGAAKTGYSCLKDLKGRHRTVFAHI